MLFKKSHPVLFRTKGEIENIFCASRGTYGSPRIHQALRSNSISIGRKRVERLMRELGLKARSVRIYRRKVKTRIFYKGIPNRCVFIEPTGPDQVWVGDTAYLKTASGWRYLAIVMDKFSRRIVGWSLSDRKDMNLTMAAFNYAVINRRPEPGLIIPY